MSLILIRQTGFELYQIPSGSMRPTYRENDLVLVSKSAFGMSWPFYATHLYFNPSLVQRADVVIWTGDGATLPAKRYIKRIMAKGGDTVYFYGGRLYGMDAAGRDISKELARPLLEHGLDYLPFSSFEGLLDPGPTPGTIYLKQMNQPIARLVLGRFGHLQRQIYNGCSWIHDEPHLAGKKRDSVRTYSDFWGIGNYAKARLLAKEQVLDLTGLDPASVGDAPVYLELRHHPALEGACVQFAQGSDGQMHLQLPVQISLLPLHKEHKMRLMEAMYTSRFSVREGRAAAYSKKGALHAKTSPLFSKVPDGTYEFINGIAYQIKGAKQLPLPFDHPLYSSSWIHLQRLFNLGMELDDDYMPQTANQVQTPSRFAYFRSGDLYVMGKPLFKKQEPLLKAFIEREKTRSYAPFIDFGPPLKPDGRLDKRFVHAFGLRVPEGHYLVLGDNHAKSGDSRSFGFVPQRNIQGAAHFLLWPVGARWGPSERFFSTLLLWPFFLMLSGLALGLICLKRYSKKRSMHLVGK